MQETQVVHEKMLARKKAKSLREQLHKNYCDTAPKQLSNFVPDLLKNFKCSVVAGFFPIYTEINIIPLMQELAAKRCKLCLPVTPIVPNVLIFRSYILGQKLELGSYNTKHPGEESFQEFPDLVLIPLLSFDKDFNRLGYGGGYYDRTIFKYRRSKQKVAFVGVAYSEQVIDKVPTTLDDAPLDGILTPSGLTVRRTWFS